MRPKLWLTTKSPHPLSTTPRFTTDDPPHMFLPDDVLRLIRDTVHHPATARELTQVLRIPREERPAFKRLLKTLVADGDLLQIRGHRFGIPEKMDLVVGKLTTNPSG